MSCAEIFDADLSDLRSASAAARGVDTIIYCVGLPYPSHHLLPGADAHHAAGGARDAGAADRAGLERVQLRRAARRRASPRRIRALPHTRKGQYRKEQEDLVLDAQKKGQIEGLVVRLPDFYGPGAENSLANPIFRAALAGKTANWLGPVNTPHEFVYVPDTGPVIADLANAPTATAKPGTTAARAQINSLDFITRDLPRGRPRAEVSHRRERAC